jgi:hypothetical protein
MKLIIIILSVIAVALSVFILFESWFYKINEGLNDNQPRQLGNVVSSYFFHLVKSILKKKDFNVSDTPGTLLDSEKEKDFIKHFPKHLPYKYDDIYDKLLSAGISSQYFDSHSDELAMWTINDKETETIWIIIKPIVQSILDDAFQKSDLVKTVNVPVIHFRCADVPFARHFVYHFQKYAFYKDALKDISSKITKFNSVQISYCNDHNSSEENKTSCDIYIKSLCDYLLSIGYDSTIKCQSSLDDFATLYYAPAVISTGSSFSFMSGFFGKGIFISAGHQNEGEVQAESVGEWLYKGYNVMHSEISDYHDTANVIKKLYE